MRILAFAMFCVLLPAASDAPTADEQTALIAAVRRQGLDYNRNLADFLCTQITRRSTAQTPAGPWKLQDTLTIRVAYSKQREDYRVVRIDDKPVDKDLDKVGGHQTRGEFGSILRDILSSSSKGEFRWERWSSLNGATTAVLSFRIAAASSPFRTWTRRFRSHRYTWGAAGELEVDRNTHQVFRILLRATEIPRDCPVTDIEDIIVYGQAKIGDASFLLPLRSESSVRVDNRSVKAETRFTDYRKFTSETGIRFETGDPP